MSMSLAAAMKDAAYGFKYVGILNGMPATPDDDAVGHAERDTHDHPQHTDSDGTLKCYRAPDGSEFWRQIGFGSI